MTGVPTRERDTTFPAHGSDDEKLRFLLRYAVLAPSGHNTQPWLFSVADGALEVHADRSRRLPVVDPDDRALTISCGAAIAFAVVALRHFGHAGQVEVLPDPDDPDLLATVRLGAHHQPTEADTELFGAIEERHTHRAAFEDRPIPQSLLEAMQRDARGSGATLYLVDDTVRADLAELVAEGDRRQFGDPAFRAELASWVRTNRSTTGDGMPGYAFGIGDLASFLGPWMIKHVDTGGKQAEKDLRSALTAPALGVLATDGDAPADWIAAGRALGLLLLRGAAYGVQGSFLNQPIETAALRGQVASLLGIEARPQLMLRFGYAGGDRPTPRRQPPMQESS